MKTYSRPALNEVSLAEVMHALSDPCRSKIVDTLIEAEGRALACNEFELNVGKATVSHHFEVLRGAGLIETKVEGTKCLSSLRVEEFEERFPNLLNLLVSESKR